MSLKSLLIISLLLFPLFISGQWDDVIIKVNPVQGNVYMLEGRGGNMGLFVDEDKVVLIDDQFAPLSDPLFN